MAFKLKLNDIKFAYMCAVDWEYHVENDYFGATSYPSLKALRDNRPCIKGCGYVKIQMIRRSPRVSPR